MANISINKKLFEKEIGKLDEKMQNKVAMFGTTVESVSDTDFEINVNPNRPDLLSYQGFKRSFLSFLGKQKGLKEYKVNKPEKDYSVIIDSSVKNIRPYTACAIVRGLKFDDEKIKEIIDVQEKLHFTVGRKRKKLAIGIYPLEKIKLPITFKALEPDKIKFIPLESDREMSGLQILQRHPTGREYAHLLAGKSKFPIFVDAENNVLSMPPIINSQKTGKITEETTDVFVECSGFDFSVLQKCLNMIVTILADMGGKIYQMELKEGGKKKITPDLTPEKMKLNIQNANSLLGLNLNEKQVKEFIEKMGHNYNKGIVEIPSWRTDMLHEVDLIEDIAIAYGYENFIPEIPEISTVGKESGKEIIKRKIAEILTGLNILETSSYHLTSKSDQFKKMSMPEENAVEIEASKTDYTILRKDLSHYLMKILSENVDSEYPQKIFETGKVFSNYKETESLALAVAPANFTEVRQILEYLSRMLNVEIKITEPESKIPNYFIEGRTAEIFLMNGLREDKKEKSIGFLGEIHPKILKNWKIKMPVSLFEISLEEIFRKLE
ncbi:MAG: phenylalanine--tRNA ligase subunit beta [Candidatus Nanoarchaeia archaeon]|nr:phenylalanine--tRNA ligase subunit beta [Candidatus Nanoarchaeia archaeon]MDD5357909.1 phenylalanine--tRNA ligase subunit beta [Candidatus Nanoarchaeia archaeon]MDD5588828.1 phenylalanine--tRNA ligase subunit beta [Candidatus Nanoarchaeia archaeon]